jgi:hypothetical protein
LNRVDNHTFYQQFLRPHGHTGYRAVTPMSHVLKLT